MMGPETVRRMQAMMMTPIFLDSPCAVYGQAQSLGLNEEQKKRLGEIEKEAGKKRSQCLRTSSGPSSAQFRPIR